MRLHGGVRLGWLGLAALLAAPLAGCSTLGSLFGGEDADVMLKGNDPVTYFVAGRPMPGHRDITARHRERTYRFASDENRRLFITSPERYVPQFDGFCAKSMTYAIPVPAEPEHFKIIDGRLYLFETVRARIYFDMDQERNLRLATRYWDTEVRDANPTLQALKRQMFRVPNYKTEEELLAEYERRFGRKPGT